MPIYEYKCVKCEKLHEVIQKFGDEPLRVCPDCGGDLKKLISNTSFVLKGTGWYLTDYASGDRKKSMESEGSSETSKTEKTEKTEKPDKTDKPEKSEKAEPAASK